MSTPNRVDRDQAEVPAAHVVRLEIEDARWQEMTVNHPQASVFHSAGWTRLLADCYGFVPFLVAALDQEQHMMAGLPMVEISSRLTGRRWKSLPFSDHVPVLSTTAQAATQLLEQLVTWRKEGSAPDIELRGPTIDSPLAFQDPGHVLHLIHLSSNPDELWSRFHTSVRTAVRAAARAGVQVEFDTSFEGILRFYELDVGTRHRLGLPAHPRRFFELIWQRFIEPGFGYTEMAYEAHRPIAGGIRLIHNKRLTAVCAASDASSWRLRPNNAMAWAAIRRACESGIEVFDWGRSDVGNLGLRTFKINHAATELPLVYTTMSLHPPRVKAGRVKRSSAVILRHAPVWMVRQVGERLLRHFA